MGSLWELRGEAQSGAHVCSPAALEFTAEGTVLMKDEEQKGKRVNSVWAVLDLVPAGHT